MVPISGRRDDGPVAEDVVVLPAGVVVEFDEVERRAVRALAEAGLVPPLRHQPSARPAPPGRVPERRVGEQKSGRRTG